MKESDLETLGEYKCEACRQAKADITDSVETKKDIKVVKKEPSPPPTKRQKTGATESKIVDEKIAKVRSRVVENLTQAFLSNELDTKLTDFDVSSLCESIEASLFNSHQDKQGQCGSSYRTKYMSLLFNLRDTKNVRLRQQILDGTIAPSQLVLMTPEEMANEELSELIKSVRERSVANAMLDEEVVDGFIRKTHKGEEPLNALQDNQQIPFAPYIPPPLYIPESDSNRNANHDDSPVTRTTDWNGLVLLQDVANFEATADLLSTSPLSETLRSQFPANLHISGRISPSRALSYLESIKNAPSRSIFIFLVDPVLDLGIQPNSKADPAKLINYLTQSERWAVLSLDTSGSLRDLYLAPSKGLEINSLSSLGFIIDEASLARFTDKSFVAILVTSSAYSAASSSRSR